MFLLFYPFKKFSILKIFLFKTLFANQSTAHSWGVSRQTTGYEPLVDPQSDSRLRSLNPNSRFLIQTLNQTPDSESKLHTLNPDSMLIVYEGAWRLLEGLFFIVKESLELTWLKAGVFQSNYFFLFYIFFYDCFPLQRDIKKRIYWALISHYISGKLKIIKFTRMVLHTYNMVSNVVHICKVFLTYITI